MQETVKNETSDLLIEVIEYYDFVADELDACHPEAFEVLYDIITRRPSDNEIDLLLSDFHYEFSEELEACNEEALEMFKKFTIKNVIAA